jgi:endoglucanase
VLIYAGGLGENTDEWVRRFRRLVEENNFGWHFWPYKKMDSPKNMVSILLPPFYDSVIRYAEGPRGSFKELRNAAPVHRQVIEDALNGFLQKLPFCQLPSR